MRRQAKLQPAVQLLVGAHVAEPTTSGFAGVAFEGAGLTLYYRGALTERMARALKQARRYGPVRVHNAAYSATELQRAGGHLHAAIAKAGHSDIQSVGYRYD